MKKLFAIYFLFLASQPLMSLLDLYVLQSNPAFFPTYSDISTIAFLLWTCFWTVWFFRTDAELRNARFSYAMAFGLVFLLPVSSFIYYIQSRGWKTGLLHALGFWAGIVAAVVLAEYIYTWAV